MSRFFAFWGNIKGFYLVHFFILLSKEDFFLLLHNCCFYRCGGAVLFCLFYAVLLRIHFCRKLCTFSSKIVLLKPCWGKKIVFFHVCFLPMIFTQKKPLYSFRNFVFSSSFSKWHVVGKGNNHFFDFYLI